MTTLEIEKKITAAFHGGEICLREVRLTTEEAQYVAAHHAATVAPLGRGWYEISFMGANCNGD